VIENDVRARAYAMPMTNPAFPPGPYCFASLLVPDYLLKIIPHVAGTARIRELVRYFCEDVVVKAHGKGRPRWICSLTHSHPSRRCRCSRSFRVSTSRTI